MGLQSLAGDRHHTGLTEPVAAFFEKQGARMLGVADNSFVFQDPSDTARVVKVSLAPQDGWKTWARWTMQVLRSFYPTAHLPRVYTYHQVGAVLIAQMERLEPLPAAHPLRRAMRECKRHPVDLAQHPGLRGTEITDLLLRAHTIFPDAHWDLGPSNWMTRPGCGTLILNDPISHLRQ